MGLVGTFVYPVLQKRKGVIGTGGIAIWFQLSFLSLCVLSTAYASDPGCDAVHTELGLLISGVVLSRMGLWVFDLAVTQLLQQEVDTPTGGERLDFSNSERNARLGSKST